MVPAIAVAAIAMAADRKPVLVCCWFIFVAP
jgi:hypothetical protein